MRRAARRRGMQPESAATRFGRWWFAGGEPRLSALDLALAAGFLALLLAGAWFAEAFFHRAQHEQPDASGGCERPDQPRHAAGDPHRRHRPQRRLGGGARRRAVRRHHRPARHRPRGRGRDRRRRRCRPRERGHRCALQAAILHRHARHDGYRARRRLSLYRDPALAFAFRLSRPRRDPDRSWCR